MENTSKMTQPPEAPHEPQPLPAQCLPRRYTFPQQKVRRCKMFRHRRNKPCPHKMNRKALTRMSRQIALHPESGSNRKTITLQRSDPVGRAPTTTPSKNDRRRTYAGVREHVTSWT